MKNVHGSRFPVHGCASALVLAWVSGVAAAQEIELHAEPLWPASIGSLVPVRVRVSRLAGEGTLALDLRDPRRGALLTGPAVEVPAGTAFQGDLLAPERGGVSVRARDAGGRALAEGTVTLPPPAERRSWVVALGDAGDALRFLHGKGRAASPSSRGPKLRPEDTIGVLAIGADRLPSSWVPLRAAEAVVVRAETPLAPGGAAALLDYARAGGRLVVVGGAEPAAIRSGGLGTLLGPLAVGHEPALDLVLLEAAYGGKVPVDARIPATSWRPAAGSATEIGPALGGFHFALRLPFGLGALVLVGPDLARIGHDLWWSGVERAWRELLFASDPAPLSGLAWLRAALPPPRPSAPPGVSAILLFLLAVGGALGGAAAWSRRSGRPARLFAAAPAVAIAAGLGAIGWGALRQRAHLFASGTLAVVLPAPEAPGPAEGEWILSCGDSGMVSLQMPLVPAWADRADSAQGWDLRPPRKSSPAAPAPLDLSGSPARVGAAVAAWQPAGGRWSGTARLPDMIQVRDPTAAGWPRTISNLTDDPLAEVLLGCPGTWVSLGPLAPGEDAVATVEEPAGRPGDWAAGPAGSPAAGRSRPAIALEGGGGPAGLAAGTGPWLLLRTTVRARAAAGGGTPAPCGDVAVAWLVALGGTR